MATSPRPETDLGVVRWRRIIDKMIAAERQLAERQFAERIAAEA